MLDYLRNLRLQSLFGNMGQEPDPTFPNVFGPQSPDAQNYPTAPQTGALSSIADRMSGMYKPDTSAADNFANLQNNYPTAPKPSIGKKIAGVALASLPDINNLFDKAGRFNPQGRSGQGGNIYNDVTGKTQHDEDVVDWKNKIGPAQQAANIERQSNSNDRQAAYQAAALELRDEAQAAKQSNDEKKIAISEHRAQIYEFKAKHGDAKFNFSGPTVLVADPKTGKVVDTGLPTGSLSEMDKINLGQENAIAKIDETANEQRKTNDDKQSNATAINETRGWKVGTIPDPNDPSKSIGIRYNEITGETKPITFDGKNVSSITGPGKSGAGATNNEAAQAVKQKAQETLDALGEILDEKGKLRDNMKSAVGASRMMGLQYLPATETRAGDVAIKRLKSMLIVELIGEMKQQSKTGATGFGQLNMKELGVLEQAASKLDPSLDEGTFETELNRIREKLKKILQPTDGLNPTTTVKKLTVDDYLKKYNKGGGL